MGRERGGGREREEEGEDEGEEETSKALLGIKGFVQVGTTISNTNINNVA